MCSIPSFHELAFQKFFSCPSYNNFECFETSLVRLVTRFEVQVSFTLHLLCMQSLLCSTNVNCHSITRPDRKNGDNLFLPIFIRGESKLFDRLGYVRRTHFRKSNWQSPSHTVRSFPMFYEKSNLQQSPHIGKPNRVRRNDFREQRVIHA